MQDGAPKNNATGKGILLEAARSTPTACATTAHAGSLPSERQSNLHIMQCGLAFGICLKMLPSAYLVIQHP